MKHHELPEYTQRLRQAAPYTSLDPMPTTNPTQRKTTDPSASRMPWISLTLVAAAIAVMPFDRWTAWLQYDRTAVGDGQLWRLITCQFTHWSWDHLFWDAAALLFLGWVLEKEARRSMLICLGLSAVLIPAFVHFGLPDLATYRGLSGIDSAVFVLLAVTLLRRCYADGDRLWTCACVAMLVGFSAKVGFELLSGDTLFVDAQTSHMLPVPLVHVVGGALGAACGWLAKKKGTSYFFARPPKGRQAEDACPPTPNDRLEMLPH